MIKNIILILILLPIGLWSQHICVTDEYNKPLYDSNPIKYEQIEKDLQHHLRIPKQKDDNQIVIPVVFHIVWIDDNQNLPDSVIHHQLEVLNKSFNLKNNDTVILTDTLKKWVGNFNIKFELAYKDPNGILTNGITRKKTINPHFSYYNDPVKDSHYGTNSWPTGRYLNIWVCNLLDGFHGYAQFPGGPIETDGVVVDWQTVGNGHYPWTYPNSENLACGKVLVHEIGHWLNLYHPWGNTTSGCGDDYIPETGLQDGPVYHTNDCYDTLFSLCNPSERVFVKHYMDYSGCDCMVTFTKNQVDRGLSSLMTQRLPMIENYERRPTLNGFEGTIILPTLVKDKLYFTFPKSDGVITIIIYDLMGREILKSSTSQQFKEITFNTPNGYYIVCVLYNGEVVRKQKIIVY